MLPAFEEYETHKLVNVHRHVDGAWFWDKYSAHPYTGCRAGCAFCYERGGKYLGRRAPDDFDRTIRVKVNAVDRLRRELARLEPDVIACGDWQQPAENRYRLSRGMLEVVLEAGFPLLIIERSPLVTRDLDLLQEIHRRSHVSVLFSFSSLDPALKRAFEPRSPGFAGRLQAMEALAGSGIPVGTALMPILPMVGDDEAHLEEVVRATRDHGGAFVLAGGLTMEGAQAQRTLAALRQLAPSQEQEDRFLSLWRRGDGPARIGLLVRELCARHGLKDRMPRYVAPGPLAANKRIAERLFLKTWDLELAGASQARIWTYRKAAWAIDEHPASLDAGACALPQIAAELSREIAAWLAQEPEPPATAPASRRTGQLRLPGI